MQKKLLVTVSDDLSYLYGVRFVGSFFRNKPSVSVTLFYVAPRAGATNREADYEQVELDKRSAEAAQKKAQGALDAARQMLCDRGFPPENVDSKFIFRQFGTVKDIIREARKGAYDAVVLGRRGYTLLESIFATSITKEILEREIDFPIWICRHPEENRKNVLLCVDGSDCSLRMVDHVGFMLRDENEHGVTLFSVDTGEGESKEVALKAARQKLMDNWISDGRVTTVVTASSLTGVAKAIIEETQAKSYAAVGVGRVGVDKGRLTEWLVGSRTMQLLETMDKAGLWIGS